MPATLADIRTKVRRLTRSPSTQQLSNADLDNYINDFVLYDFPEELRLFSLKQTFTFYTQPDIDTYNESLPGMPAYLDEFITFHPPAYVAGEQMQWSQSRQELFSQYPLANSRVNVGTGNGTVTQFSGTLSAPVLKDQVTFSAIGTNQNQLTMIDKPVEDLATGRLGQSGNLYVPANVPTAFDTVVDATNTINYITGAFTVTFPTAVGNDLQVQAQSINYSAALPRMCLYYNNQFIFRPVPDRPYRVTMDAYVRPTQFLSANPGQIPELEQWWQYIAYGASKKVFEDHSDIASVQEIMPEFKRQERLVLRRTLVQRTNQRTATIYTEQSEFSQNRNNWWGPF